MTGKQKTMKFASILSSIKSSPLNIEMKKSSRGAVFVASGIMSVGELSEDSVTLLSHSGRLVLIGDNLGISVFENRIVEVYGKITEVKLSYGKT